jgi:hypothetical protein
MKHANLTLVTIRNADGGTGSFYMRDGGNPADYTGLLIVLGGSVSVSGGGNFNINGGLFLANVNTSAPPWTFGATTSGVTGGGGMSITYNSNPGNIGGGNPFQNWKER